MNGWIVTGPGCGGALYRPTVSPASRDRALIACDMTGSYLTADGGGRWKQLDFGAVARAFAFDPAHPDTVWAGASGLFRSENNGASWRLVLPRPGTVRGEEFLDDEADHRLVADPVWEERAVESILVDPADSRRLFIGVAGSAPDRPLRLLSSPDQGESFFEAAVLPGREWIALLPGRSPGSVMAITDAVMCSLESDTAIALPLPVGVFRIIAAARGAALYLSAAATNPAGRFQTRLLRSRDEGRSWEDLASGLEPPLSGNRVIRFPCLAAGVSASRTDPRGDTVYLSVAEPAPQQGSGQTFGIMKSTDSGASWQWSLQLSERQPGNRVKGWVEVDFNPDWGGAPFGLGMRPGDPDCCYATDWGTVYRTVDGGERWEQLYAREGPAGAWRNRGVNVTNVYGVFLDPFDPQRAAMACTDVGLFASHDGCQSWRHSMEGIPAAWQNTCYWIAFDPSVKGRAWSAWSGCHDLPREKMLRTDAYRSSPGGVARTDDGMASWQPSVKGLPVGPVTHLDLDPASPVEARRLLAAVFGHGVFASVDGGESWQEASTGVGPNRNAWNLCRSGTVIWLLVARGMPAGTMDPGALYRSDDGAATWRAVELPPGVSFPSSIAVDPAGRGRVYLSCWPLEKEGRRIGGGLLVSDDGGARWTRCFDESTYAYGVSVGADRSVYLCTFEGRTLRSTDGGTSWAVLGGIRFKWQKTVQQDPRDPSRIFISTFGAGLWHGPALGTVPTRGHGEQPPSPFRVDALDVAPGAPP